MSIQTPYFEYRVKMYSILVQILPGLETGSLTVNLTIRTPSWVVCEASIVLIQLIFPIIKTFHQGLTWENASIHNTQANAMIQMFKSTEE